MNISNKTHYFYDGYDIDMNLLNDINYIKIFVNEIISNFFIQPYKIDIIPYFNSKMQENGGISATIISNGEHFTIHTFCYKACLFIDAFGENFKEDKLLSIVNDFFKADNYDLCNNNNNNISGHFGKHMIITCKKNIPFMQANEYINLIINEIQMTKISDIQIMYKDKNNYDILQAIAESHISIHSSNDYVYIDIFSCKSFDHELIKLLLDIDDKDYTLVQRGVYFPV